MSRFQFVADNSTTFEVKRLCQAVEVTRSSFYAWKAGAPARAARTAAATAAGLRYVGDITYLPCGDGQGGTKFLYLATVIDLYSRRLVGWSIADHMRTSLVEDALKAAAATRGSIGLEGSIFHSDHGSVYCSADYARLCGRLGVSRSMGRVGTSADNALAESFNATMKRETLAGQHAWADTATCRREVFKWILRYNTHRRHSACGYLSPMAYEQATSPPTTTSTTLAA